MLKLQRDSWHHRLVQYSWPGYYTQDFCNYFWRIVSAILLIPLTLIGRGAMSFVPDYDFETPPPVWGLLVSVTSWLYLSMAISTWALTSSVAITTTVATTPLWLSVLILSLTMSDMLYLTKIKLKAWKEQRCPVIRWDED